MEITIERASTTGHLSAAVHRNKVLNRSGLLERAFTLAFRNLVYAQIWEDPVIDMEALAIRPTDHLVTIASGGCNAMSYLTAAPRRITAVDLNAAHVALGRLKIAAVRNLGDYDSFRSIFAEGSARANIDLYQNHIRPNLDFATRTYWDARSLSGRRRIEMFARNPYRHGLLGRFITLGHLLSRAHGVDLRQMSEARSIDEQKYIFDTQIAPLFDRRFIRWLTRQPASLYGLGIPPAQYVSLSGGGPERMSDVLRGRLRKLACDFDLKSNYFARQAFGRGYGDDREASLPPYLEQQNFARLREMARRLEFVHASMTDVLRSLPPGGLDCLVLLDAQDWMSPSELNSLWTEITRVAAPGARVIFRTAGEPSILPGAVESSILDRWAYDPVRCADWTRRDRSSIYGGFHLYQLKATH